MPKPEGPQFLGGAKAALFVTAEDTDADKLSDVQMPAAGPRICHSYFRMHLTIFIWKSDLVAANIWHHLLPASELVIGAEPFVNGVASLLRHMDERALQNIRIWPDDVRLILPSIADASLVGAYIMFPDPWPKRRHASRRILNQDMLDALAN